MLCGVMKSSAVPCVMMILPPLALNFSRLTSVTSMIDATVAMRRLPLLRIERHRVELRVAA